jgi:predicted RNase H-like nuclease
MGYALGVDWDGGRWLCLAHGERDSVPAPDTYESLADLWKAYDEGADITRLCIDIPICLPTGPAERAVDKRCPSYLDRTSTVFRVPVREALKADTPTEANKKSQMATKSDDTDGVGVQPPAYSIRNQILDVNNFVSDLASTANDIIYEVHPELCFTTLGEDSPQYSKTTAQGVAERLEALDTIVEDAATIFGATLTAIENEVGSDHEIRIADVLDTLAATYTAAAPQEEFQLLTGDKEHTPPQRMAYRSSTKLPNVDVS